MNWDERALEAGERALQAPRSARPTAFAAVSKSMRPSASPSWKYCFGWKSNFSGAPTLRSSLFAVSSPTGTSAAGTFGMAASRSAQLVVEPLLLGLAFAKSWPSARRPRPSAASPRLHPCSPSLADLLRGGVAAGLRLLQFLKRAAALLVQAQNSSQGLAGLRRAPRSVSPLRKASWFSQIHLMSSKGRSCRSESGAECRGGAEARG